jgi:hypothetical protein
VERNVKQNRGSVKMSNLKHIAAALALTLSAFAIPAASHASAFVAWKVTDVPWGDVLNVPAPAESTFRTFRACRNGSSARSSKMSGASSGMIRPGTGISRPGG